MTHFAMVNIIYSSKSIAKKAGMLYSDTLTYISCRICHLYVPVLIRNRFRCCC